MRIQPTVLKAIAEQALALEKMDVSMGAFNFGGYTVTVDFTSGGNDASVKDDRTMWITSITRNSDRVEARS